MALGRLQSLLRPDRPALVGMVHLAPLPGSPRYDGDMQGLRSAMLRDAEALVAGGMDALIVENFGDAPFFPGAVPPITLATMTALAAELRAQCPLPLGINLLRNDASGALAVAHAVGADFLRVNVLVGARVTDQGLVEGSAHSLLRERAALGAEAIAILADVAVKHSRPLSGEDTPESVRLEAADAAQRGGADALVVTGGATGSLTPDALLDAALAGAGGTPVLVGSGVDEAGIAALRGRAHGVIVGSSLKEGGVVTAPVDRARVEGLVAARG